MDGINNHVDYALKRLVEMGALTNEVRGLMILRDCILIERFTGKTYTYRAFNYITGEHHYLGSRKSAINKEHYLGILEKIKKLPFFNTVIPTDGIELIDYIFRSVFTNYGFVVRDEQVELSKQMYQILMGREILLSDIPVGLGKTHAYLIAAIVYSLMNKRNYHERKNYRCSNGFMDQTPMPIVVSTSSIQLQKAIEKEYIPGISKMLIENDIIDTPITSVIRKGKENYICDMRLKNYINTLDPLIKPMTELDTLRSLMEGSVIDLGEVTGISNYDKRKINIDSEVCYNCSKFSSCRFQQFMEKAKKSDFHFQICNHNYFFADLLRRKKSKSPLLPSYKAAIIDEAHKFIQAATDMYGVVLNQKDIELISRQLKPVSDCNVSNRSLQLTCKEIARLNELLFIEFKNSISVELFDEPIEKYSIKLSVEMKALLKRLLLNLKHLLELLPSSKGQYIGRIKRITEVIEVVISEDAICWIEYLNAQVDHGQFCSVTKNIEELICNDLFKLDLPFVLTSGTIAVDGDFEYFVRSIGIDKLAKKRAKYLSMKSPFDYQKNSLIYQSTDIPFSDTENNAYIQAIALEIERLIRASHGHALVLFTSYSPLRKVYRLLEEMDFDFPIFRLHKGSQQAIKEYRESKNGVLFACGSMWEGIDFKR